MTKITILFADNDPDFLETRREFLQKEGFKVKPAQSFEEAGNILRTGGVDLAILDMRLINDNDAKDMSGLNLAKKEAPHIPKIILTRFPTYQAAREALAPQLDGLPTTVDFIAKQEGPQAMLTAVRKALKLDTRFRETLDSLAERISDDYDDTLHQARWNFRVSVVVAVIGIIVIFCGIGLSFGGMLAIGVSGTVAGIITEAIGILFFKRADRANERLDHYHKELLELRQFENLLAACDELSGVRKQATCKKRIVEAATRLWLGGKPSVQSTASKN